MKLIWWYQSNIDVRRKKLNPHYVRIQKNSIAPGKNEKRITKCTNGWTSDHLCIILISKCVNPNDRYPSGWVDEILKSPTVSIRTERHYYEQTKARNVYYYTRRTSFADLNGSVYILLYIYLYMICCYYLLYILL